MQRADTILVNGVICTVDPSFRFVQALAVGDDKILYCGNNRQALQLQGDGTKIIDLEGKLVLPGTFDAHIHAAYAGLSLSPDFVKVEPEDASNLKELNDRIREKAGNLPADTWIIGWGRTDADLERYRRGFTGASGHSQRRRPAYHAGQQTGAQTGGDYKRYPF